MKKYLFLLTLFSCFMFANCTKDNGVHVNKFTCKVNGVFWEAIPRERDILGNDLQMDKSPIYDVLSLRARNVKKDQSIRLDFSFSDTSKVSNVLLNLPFSDYSRKCDGYFLDTLSKRIVTISDHDKVKRIAKGTFVFRAIDIVDSCKDTVTITDGFFDMQY
jgi:hypothetical protein